MVPQRLRSFYADKAVVFLNKVMEDKPTLPFLIPLVLFAWAIERWLVPLSNWVPLAFAVWATIQHGRFQRQQLVQDLNRRWKQLILYTAPSTPLEPSEWLNKLLMEIWPNYMEPKLSRRFSSTVERRLKHRKPNLLEKIELHEFSLGSCPPILGQHGVHWITSGDQQVLRAGFDWDTNDMSVMLLAKLAKPLIGTAKIVINNIHIKGHLRLIPILAGQALLYSFESTPEVRVGVVFGGGSQTLPATELPGVSNWLVKVFTETLVKMMVEPRRLCFSLPSINLGKKAVGGVLAVTIVSANRLSRKKVNTNSLDARQFSSVSNSARHNGDKLLQTFVEVEIGKLARRTSVSEGSSPIWDDTFNLVLHGDAGILRFHLYEWRSNSVKFDYLASCEIKMKYVADGSTTFWAIGPNSGVLAKQAESCGKEFEMVVPFEEANLGELKVRLVLKEWQYSDNFTSSSNSSGDRTQHFGSHHLQIKTGRKVKVTVVEGKNLTTKEKSGKCDPYVKLQYGKDLHRTKTISHSSNPVWNQKFDFDELRGEYLRVKCCSADLFGDANIGSAGVNLEGLPDGSYRDVWIPLEKVNTGELRLQIEAVRSDDYDQSNNSLAKFGSGWIELVLIEARDLIAADLRGTSDPYVRVQYGSTKKRTKVVYKTLNPQWNQTLEFPDTGSHLALHVKDHNALLPTSSIGDCVVEYKVIPPNHTVEKWIPLQGVKSGEIHVQITRRFPEMHKKTSLATDFSKSNRISGQVRDLLKKLQVLVEDGDLEGLSLALSELETAEDVQDEYMAQLEKEKTLLIEKISELGHEIVRTSSAPCKVSF